MVALLQGEFNEYFAEFLVAVTCDLPNHHAQFSVTISEWKLGCLRLP